MTERNTQRCSQPADQPDRLIEPHRISAAMTARSAQSSRGRRLAPQHGDLVSQHEQFRVFGRRRTTEQNQPTAQLREDEIEQTEGHGRSSCATAWPFPSLQLTGQADF